MARTREKSGDARNSRPEPLGLSSLQLATETWDDDFEIDANVEMGIALLVNELACYSQRHAASKRKG